MEIKEFRETQANRRKVWRDKAVKKEIRAERQKEKKNKEKDRKEEEKYTFYQARKVKSN
jgi:hypothetical protein